MRRFAIGLATLLALSLMLAAVAVAAPPNCEELPLEHPQYCGDPCDELPFDDPNYCGLPCWDLSEDDPNWCETPTTTIPEPPDLDPCLIDTFSVESDPGWTRFGCDWILPVDAPSPIENGVITVDLVSGKISILSVMVHDSSPGDICELNWLGKTLQDSEWYEGPLPADGLALTVPLEDGRGNYWDFEYDPDPDNPNNPLVSSSGGHWCGPYDPIEGLRTDLNGDPLRLYLTMRATNGTVVEVTLNPVGE